MKNIRRFLLTAVASIVISSAVTSVISNTTYALSGSDFKAGRIIDDDLFYNGTTMTASQIQDFLNSKVLSCDTNGEKMYNSTQTRAQYGESKGYPAPYTCLKSYKQDTGYKAGQSGLCSAIEAKTNRTAAQIIDDVARACHISQKVIIVMLQKEQGLVTDDWPWSIQYRGAMGYGCPDDNVCDSEYYGFFNQVYNAALQFQRYKADPTYWNHVPFMTNQVLYQANAPSCGSKSVYIENYATAGLYNYTPYTPNQKALDNLYGTGDGCSAYGNRNFWRYYNDWFGSTEGTPFFQIGGDSKVYMLGSNDNYYYVPNAKTMRAYGWQSSVKRIATYSNGYLSGKSYSGALPLIARFGGDEIYLIDLGLRRHFTSRSLLTTYGYEVGKEALLPETYLPYYKKVASIQPIVRDVGRGHIYLITDTKKRHFTGPSAYKSGSPAYSSLPRIDLSSEYIDSMKYGARIYAPGTAIRIGSASQVYAINTINSKIYIPNTNVFKAYGFSSKNILSIDRAQSDAHSRDPIDLTVFVKNKAGSIFLADSAGIFKVSSTVAGSSHFNVDPLAINTLDDRFINTKLNGKNLTEVIRAAGDSKVYLVENGKKSHVKSPSALYDMGYTFDDVTDLSAAFVNSIP